MANNFVNPASDPDFAVNPFHGEEAQRKLFNAAIVPCRSFRTAIDVGAHIGLWTRMLADKFETVFAYEPEPHNYDCLLENVGHLEGVHLQQVAIGKVQSTGSLWLPHQANSGCWFVSDLGGDVPILSLDLFGLRNVDLIKLDVEGAEGFVIQGASELLSCERPVVIFEDNALGVKHFGDRWVDPKPLLYRLGYKCLKRVKKNEIWV
jgi:FkbM family methyltransferase